MLFLPFLLIQATVLSTQAGAASSRYDCPDLLSTLADDCIPIWLRASVTGVQDNRKRQEGRLAGW